MGQPSRLLKFEDGDVLGGLTEFSVKINAKLRLALANVRHSSALHSRTYGARARLLCSLVFLVVCVERFDLVRLSNIPGIERQFEKASQFRAVHSLNDLSTVLFRFAWAAVRTTPTFAAQSPSRI
jgi:hypothetical protein